MSRITAKILREQFNQVSGLKTFAEVQVRKTKGTPEYGEALTYLKKVNIELSRLGKLIK